MAPSCQGMHRRPIPCNLLFQDGRHCSSRLCRFFSSSSANFFIAFSSVGTCSSVTDDIVIFLLLSKCLFSRVALVMSKMYV